MSHSYLTLILSSIYFMMKILYQYLIDLSFELNFVPIYKPFQCETIINMIRISYFHYTLIWEIVFDSKPSNLRCINVKTSHFRVIFPWEYTLNRYNKYEKTYCIGPCIYIRSVSLLLNNLNNPLNVIKSMKCIDMIHFIK